ncbi:MAG: threonine ammonia-lyase [Bdellovibrionota bacterium]
MSAKKLEITLARIQEAKQELHKFLPPSPLLKNTWLSEILGCEIYLKLENMQPIGSFKIRGAAYRISQLSKRERKQGVIAASAGNHAQGVAWASRHYKVDALIVMPRTAPLVKVQNTRSLGAEVVLEGDNYDEAYLVARQIARKTGRFFIHAFEDADVIAGQGTLGLEILEQLPDVDVVIGSMGGGGLMSGVATVLKENRPQVKIIGAQASGAAAMVNSIKKGRAVRVEKVETFADGIAVSEASPVMLKLLEPLLDEVVTADDEAIANSVLSLIEKAKVVAEGSGALPLAAAELLRKKLHGKKVVLIISGGNIDVNVLSRIIDRGLIRAGRRLRVNVLLSDRPGSLARLTELLAREGANILQAIHDRSEPSTTIDLTEVALTLETRGPEHSEKVIRALRDHVIRLELTH